MSNLSTIVLARGLPERLGIIFGNVGDVNKRRAAYDAFKRTGIFRKAQEPVCFIQSR